MAAGPGSPRGSAIVVGYGRFGQIVSQMLHAVDCSVTLIDKKPSQIELSERFDTKVYFGDGLRLDLLRRAVIMSLMCQGEVQFESIELGHLIDFCSYFARELEVLEGLAAHGLVRLSPSGVQVTEAGWFLVRAIAMVFDKNLQVDRDRARFSKII